MLFSRHIKTYQVSAKHVKSAGSVVLSIGFPESEVTGGKLSFEHISEALGAGEYVVEEKQVTFRLKEDLKKNYAAWRTNHPVPDKLGTGDSAPSPLSEKISALLSDIRNFDLANSTPMQGLEFVHVLKQKVKEIAP